VNCLEGGISTNFPSGLTNSCNPSRCALALETDYWLRLNRTLNNPTSDSISATIYPASSDVQDSLWDLAQPSFQDQDRINFHKTWAYRIQGRIAQTCLDEGEAGYWAFEPRYYCVEGTLSGCDGDGYPSNGTVIRFCAPGTVTSEGPNKPDGNLHVVRCTDCNDTVAHASAIQTDAEGGNTSAAGSVGVAVWKLLPTTLLCAVYWVGWYV